MPHESPITIAISLHQTQAEQRSKSRLLRYGTVQTMKPEHRDGHFGGFGGPLNWFMNILHHFFPSLKRDLHRTLTTPLSPVLFVSDQGEVLPGACPVPYLHFRARFGHNSCFIGLSDDDYEELGGIEYRALMVLLRIVSVVRIFPSFHSKRVFMKCLISIISSRY